MKPWPLMQRLRRSRVSREDILWCYRVFLNRAPESEEVFLEAGGQSIRELIDTLLVSAEFRELARRFESFNDYLNSGACPDPGRNEAAESTVVSTMVPPASTVRGIVASFWSAEGGIANHQGAVPLAPARHRVTVERALPDIDTAAGLVRSRPWHHNFEIIPGLRTGGTHDPSNRWRELQLPEDLTGMSVADVGASNGYFSFEAYKRGADVDAFDIRHKDNSGFGLAQYINGLDGIKHHHVNVLNLEESAFGQFDIVLCLGLLYHTSDPYLALKRCATLSRTRLLVESHCYDTFLPPDFARDTLMKYWPDFKRFPEQGSTLNHDRSNFWSPTSSCLTRMVEDMGFVARRVIVNNDRVLIDAMREVVSKVDTRLGLAYDVLPAVPRGPDPNDPAAWRIF
jgi:tRNA (mo5U34)-methyltransferase